MTRPTFGQDGVAQLLKCLLAGDGFTYNYTVEDGTRVRDVREWGFDVDADSDDVDELLLRDRTLRTRLNQKLRADNDVADVMTTIQTGLSHDERVMLLIDLLEMYTAQVRSEETVGGGRYVSGEAYAVQSLVEDLTAEIEAREDLYE